MYHPSSNGISEGINQTITDVLRINKGTEIKYIMELIVYKHKNKYNTALKKSLNEYYLQKSIYDPLKRKIKIVQTDNNSKDEIQQTHTLTLLLYRIHIRRNLKKIK